MSNFGKSVDDRSPAFAGHASPTIITAQVKAIPSAAALTTLAPLSQADIIGLSIDVLASLGTDPFAVLATDQLGALTSSQIGALSQAASTNTQLYEMTPTQLTGLYG